MECTLLTGAGKESFEHKKSATFGMREVAQGRNHILLNGRPLHLRGTVENAVFPKTATPRSATPNGSVSCASSRTTD